LEWIPIDVAGREFENCIIGIPAGIKHSAVEEDPGIAQPVISNCLVF
jgi:hypothetical protein